jgi:NADPH:quinone reductase-like Zn-dependent oxidoreductase
MRAVVVTEYGGRAEAVDLPAPEVQAGQVLITVLDAGMNPMVVRSPATQFAAPTGPSHRRW